ncbi:unnamed protein product [Vitrella brassicaformis CCMP3155]|uniref:Uncharacterized protein n=1 Tax=Vitrella brassicaformis (strain CCMP3155) TaxID=1169540 RepID=A0A0G4FWN7_VITBC|nr:unnamed protein product [Vitrella brassicaformis CCMP3155]|eukprot:CEM19266.1 unnamed protein product [Vitrella brassicaformis CCMP3155]
MQPTGAAPSSRPPSPPLFQPAGLFDLSLPISKMARMVIDGAKRAALRSQIVNGTRQQELLGHTAETVNSTLLNGVQKHINKAISRLGLEDALAFDIGDDLEAGLRLVYLLEQGSGEEWRAMGRFIRLAAIYRLTPNSTLPLRLSADALPSPTAFHQLPLAMALYKAIGHSLTYHGHSLALQRAGDNGVYRIYQAIDYRTTFRVVPLSELPANHPYRIGYKTTDPVIRWDCNILYRSFASFLLDTMLGWWPYDRGVGERCVLAAPIGDDDNRHRRLLTEPISEQQQGAIAVDFRLDGGNLNDTNPHDRRHVVVSGFRPYEDVAAYLGVTCSNHISLQTTERSVGDRSQPLAHRFPTSVSRWRGVLSHFDLADAVINRGTVEYHA